MNRKIKENTVPKKIVDAQVYIGTLRSILGEGHEVPLLITGNSMNPFLIHERDTILIRSPHPPLKIGDMVFYQRKNGQYVMHRICRVSRDDDGKRLYYMIGDAQREVEGPIEEHMIFGHIIRVCRKGRWIGKGDFWWEFFEHIWIHMIPLRRPLMRIYGIKCKILKHRQQ